MKIGESVMRLTMVSVAEQVAFHLAKQIIEGQLQAKEHIQEAKLVKEFQVSRSSVREALLIVSRWHLIEIYPNRGAIVSAITSYSAEQFFEVWWVLLEKLLLDLSLDAPEEAEILLKQISSPASRQESVAVFCQRVIDKLKKLYTLSNNVYLQSVLLAHAFSLHHHVYFLLDSKKVSEFKIQQFARIVQRRFERRQLRKIHNLLQFCLD